MILHIKIRFLPNTIKVQTIKELVIWSSGAIIAIIYLYMKI